MIQDFQYLLRFTNVCCLMSDESENEFAIAAKKIRYPSPPSYSMLVDADL